MASTYAPYASIETRLDVVDDPSHSTFQIDTERPRASKQQARARTASRAAANEDNFISNRIATESSVFFRRVDRYPREILWRALENRTVLEIRAVDSAQPSEAPQASPSSFRLRFADAIRPYGITLSDARLEDTLCVAVLTTGNQLFTFSLPRDLLQRGGETASHYDPASLFTITPLASYGARNFYKLISLNDTNLLLTCYNGAVLRMCRERGEWRIGWMDDEMRSGWGSSLRSLIPWKATGASDTDASPSAVTHAEYSPDGKYLVTFTLDQILRVQNMETGLCRSLQLVERPAVHSEDARSIHAYAMDPSQGRALKIVSMAPHSKDDLFQCVFYDSESHRFRFLVVHDPSSDNAGFSDLRPDLQLLPPITSILNTNVWHMVDFEVLPGAGWRNTRLWIRVRSGSIVRTFALLFDLLQSNSRNATPCETSWSTAWTRVSDAALLDHVAAEVESLDSKAMQLSGTRSLNEQWLSMLFLPGLYDSYTIETALHMYQKGQGLTGALKHVDRDAPLRERICTNLAVKIGTTRSSSGQVNFAKCEQDLAGQWRIFFGLVRHLHQRRTESLSLVLNAETGKLWSVCADQISLVEMCELPEIAGLNWDMFLKRDHDQIMSNLVIAKHASYEQAWSTILLLAAARGFRSNLSPVVDANFERLASMHALDTNDSGRKSTSRKASPLQRLYEECDFANDVSDANFERLTDSVQELGGLGGIDNEIFLHSISRTARQSHAGQKESRLLPYGKEALLRRQFMHALFTRRQLLDVLALVTFMSQDLETEELSPDFDPNILYTHLGAALRQCDLVLWLTTNQSAEKLILLKLEDSQLSFTVMDDLLDNQQFGLASSFAKFLPSHSIKSTHSKARLYLAQGDHVSAAALLRRTASGTRSGDVLVESARLFQSAELPAYAADFAAAAIEEMSEDQMDTTGSEMLSCLFAAALNTARYEIAFEALVKFRDVKKKRAALNQLITSVLGASPALLLSLPFSADLSSEVDNALSKLSREHMDVDRSMAALDRTPVYHQMLYSWRISQQDYRGAAAALFERVSWLKTQPLSDGTSDNEREMNEAYLILINALSCCEPGEEWFLASAFDSKPKHDDGVRSEEEASKGKIRRRLITLQELRRDYQHERRRQEDVAHGRFPIVG